ncbi:MAG: hypothetical protein KJZ64_05960 [Sphingomonadaceae bacterium]|nr:hypothetical protein [Sphingomonadaceae bacterium]
MKRLILPLALFLGSGVANAEPVQPSGPIDEQLGVALAVSEQCQAMRPFEFAFLHGVWLKSWADAGDGKRINSAAAAANKGPMGWIEAAKVTFAGEAEVAERYRSKAAEIGCANAGAYANLGKLESYKASGMHVVLAASMRGQAVPAPNMTPLSPEERQLVQLYTSEANKIFGAQMQPFEALLGQLAQAHLQSFGALDPAIAAAYIEGDQKRVLNTIYLDAILSTAAYTGRARTIDDGAGFGVPGGQWSKAGKPSLTVVAGPQSVTLSTVGGGAIALSGNLALMLRADGSAMLGLFGQEASAFSGQLSAGVQTERAPPVAGTPEADCPMARCFVFSAADLARLPDASEQDGGDVWFFVSTAAAPRRSDSGMDSIKLDGRALKAMVASATQP